MSIKKKTENLLGHYLNKLKNLIKSSEKNIEIVRFDSENYKKYMKMYDYDTEFYDDTFDGEYNKNKNKIIGRMKIIGLKYSNPTNNTDLKEIYEQYKKNKNIQYDFDTLEELESFNINKLDKNKISIQSKKTNWVPIPNIKLLEKKLKMKFPLMDKHDISSIIFDIYQNKYTFSYANILYLYIKKLEINENDMKCYEKIESIRHIIDSDKENDLKIQ